MTKTINNPSTRIAPKKESGYWKIEDWQNAKNTKDWETMINIFENRMENRYFKVFRVICDADKSQPSKRFGFSIMALGCPLIETLHQFYKGYKESPNSRKVRDGIYEDPPPLKGNFRHTTNGNKWSVNGRFYCEFLTQSSFVFKFHFKDQPDAAICFYEDIRCGLLHSTETKEGSIICIHDSNEERTKLFQLINGGEDGIKLYRDTFLQVLEAEFKAYLQKLNDENNIELRNNFCDKMDFICKFSDPT